MAIMLRAVFHHFSVFSLSESKCEFKKLENFVPSPLTPLDSSKGGVNNNKILHPQKDPFAFQTKSKQFSEAMENFDVTMEVLESKFSKGPSTSLSTPQKISPELSNEIRNEGKSKRQKIRSFAESEQSRPEKSRRKCKSAEIKNKVRI